VVWTSAVQEDSTLNANSAKANELDARIGGGKSFERVARTVTAAVVDKNNFNVELAQFRAEQLDSLDRFPDYLFFVITGMTTDKSWDVDGVSGTAFIVNLTDCSIRASIAKIKK
jgi:hypothetical protein